MSIGHKKIFLRLLIFFILASYLTFIFLDLKYYGNYSRLSLYIKYSIIVACFIISLFIDRDGNSKIDTVLIVSARIFTLVADYYLMLIENYKLGILFFCIVQIIYILRHSFMETKPYKNIMFFIAAAVLALILFINKKAALENVDPAVVNVALIYAVLLSSSLYCAVRLLNRGIAAKITSIFASTGMLLFFLCDVNVAFFNIFQGQGLLKQASLSVFFIWIFYAPSQLLLTLSGFKASYLKGIFRLEG